jgi:hypothetical protein
MRSPLQLSSQHRVTAGNPLARHGELDNVHQRADA